MGILLVVQTPSYVNDAPQTAIWEASAKNFGRIVAHQEVDMVSVSHLRQPAPRALKNDPASQMTIWECWRYFVISEVLRDSRLVKHARYYWLLLAESHLTRRLLAQVGLGQPFAPWCGV